MTQHAINIQPLYSLIYDMKQRLNELETANSDEAHVLIVYMRYKLEELERNISLVIDEYTDLLRELRDK